MPASKARASECRTILVEPPIAIMTATAFSIDGLVMIRLAVMPWAMRFRIVLPAR